MLNTIYTEWRDSMKAKQLIALLCAASLTLSGCSLGKTNTTDSNSGNQTSQSEPNEPTSQTDTEIPADTSDQTADDPLQSYDNTSSAAENGSPVSVSFQQDSSTYKSDDEQTDLLYADYSKPHVTVQDNKDAENSINTALDLEEKNYQDSVEASLQDAKDFYQNDPDTFSAYGVSESYETNRCDKQVFSLRSYSYFYQNGAHGDYNYSGLNFDVNTGKQLTLDDISSDKNALLASSLDYINSQLQIPAYADGLICEPDECEDILKKDVLTDGNWYFTNSGLTFVSNVYVLGSYASGAYFFTVPYQKLEGLKPDYQYTGNFVLSGLVGSTLSVDMNNDENVDAIYYAANYHEDDDTMTCTLTINGTDYSDLLQSDDCYLTSGAASSYGMMYYYLVDLDTSDDYIELAIQDMGMSDDLVTYFFRYDGRDLNYVGQINDLFDSSSCTADGDGYISANQGMSILESKSITVTYQLTDSGSLELVPQDWYTIHDDATDSQFNTHNILQNVTVYTEADRNSDTIELTPADGPVSFPATDNEHWAIVKTASGKLYYLYLESFSFLESGQDVTEVFENMFLAG